MGSVKAWVGQYGVYEIPEELASVRITRKGWPDLRDKRAIEFLQWAADMDKQHEEIKENDGGAGSSPEPYQSKWLIPFLRGLSGYVGDEEQEQHPQVDTQTQG